MKNLRKYGKPPYTVAVIHGGPGAPGSIAPVARELSKEISVLEPLQTKDSIDGQIQELADMLEVYAVSPMTLIGWSWGATLSIFTAAHFPTLISKLILIGTPPLKAEDHPDLTRIWLERFSEVERVEFLSLEDVVWDGKREDKSSAMGQLFRLIARADSYDPLPHQDDVLEYQLDINVAIFKELGKHLASLGLADPRGKIKCPVVAIHGDYDPRPANAIERPLRQVVKDFKFYLLEKCGHYPWLERYAHEDFYKILKREIT